MQKKRERKEESDTIGFDWNSKGDGGDRREEKKD